MRCRVVVRSDHAIGHFAHAVQNIVIGDVAGTDQLDARFVHAALGELLHQRSTCARGHEHIDRIGLQITYFLQEWGKVGVAHGHAQGVEHLAAIEDQAVLEVLFCIDAWAVIGHQSHNFLDAIVGCPIGNRHGGLGQGEAGAHDERRGLRDARSRCRHHHQRGFGLGGDRCRGKRQRRQTKTGQHADFVINDHFLRNALGHVGGAGVVFHDQLHLFTRHHVAVLRHVQARCGFDLLAGRGKGACHGQDQADLELVLRHGRRGTGRDSGAGDGTEEKSFLHAGLQLLKAELKNQR